ncbi:Rhs element vgr protein [Seminavis robusta]|uniref:Rhs element vgr protein n=1 Tax=Seminavis robusta TaxID=568900 RepID=A0A9N8HY36_9STRA|nr:Rhs element vgr protein [Seminavis robusta]|eukprot:Sro1925_g305830.1 Rhs element vgr protein (505) ;mRNA; f:18407-20007
MSEVPLSHLSSYQKKNTDNDDVEQNASETSGLLTYGSIPRVSNEEHDLTDFHQSLMSDPKRGRTRRWMIPSICVLLYCLITVTVVTEPEVGLVFKKMFFKVVMVYDGPLGAPSPKSSKDESTMTKAEKKAAKEAAKAAKKAAKEAKKKAKEEAKKAKEEAKKAKKEEEKEAKAAEKLAKEPEPYPGCLEVNLTYVKTKGTWEEHEANATASGCHLASIHKMAVSSTVATASLFGLLTGLEIAASFTGGYTLNTSYWLGGETFVDSSGGLEWGWSDESLWDFGTNTSTAVAGCLKANITFTEIAVKNITPAGHWSAADCSTLLPAVYKCCVTPLTFAPTSDFPSEAPSDTPQFTESPTAAITAQFTESPTSAVTTDSPTDSAIITPEPTEIPVTSSPTLHPATPPPSPVPTKAPTTPLPTDTPTVAPVPDPTPLPTQAPSLPPVTLTPTPLPTAAPTLPPSKLPTPLPTLLPTEAPTLPPTKKPIGTEPEATKKQTKEKKKGKRG